MDHHVSEYLEARRLFQGRRRVGAAAGGVRRPFAKLHAWRTRRRAVRDLEALDDRLLADIGLTRAEIRPLVDDLLRAGRAEPPAANDNRAPIAA